MFRLYHGNNLWLRALDLGRCCFVTVGFLRLRYCVGLGLLSERLGSRVPVPLWQTLYTHFVNQRLPDELPRPAVLLRLQVRSLFVIGDAAGCLCRVGRHASAPACRIAACFAKLLDQAGSSSSKPEAVLEIGMW